MELNNQVVKRILLCTSGLQVVNARIAMDYNADSQYNYRDYIVIIHPLLLLSAKKTIIGLGENLGFHGVYDLTEQFDKQYCIANEETLFRRKLKVFNKDYFDKENDRQSQHRSGIAAVIKRNIGDVNEIYTRTKYSYYEMATARAIDGVQEYYAIEDGIGDYTPRYWHLVNGHERMHMIKRWGAMFYRRLISFLLLSYACVTGKYKLAKNIYFASNKYSFNILFSNLRLPDRECVGNQFIGIIRKLYTERPIDEERRIIIFGSILFNVYEKLNNDGDPVCYGVSDDRPLGHFNSKISNYHIMKRLVEIYNGLIVKICTVHDIDSTQIWYKRHPRLPMDFWAYFREHLDCRIFDYDDNQLGHQKFV